MGVIFPNVARKFRASDKRQNRARVKAVNDACALCLIVSGLPNIHTFSFVLLMQSPTDKAHSSVDSSSLGAFSLSLERRAMSSAKSRSVMYFAGHRLLSWHCCKANFFSSFNDGISEYIVNENNKDERC